MTNLVFLDLETTGLSPKQHEILEVGLAFEDGTEVAFKVAPAHIETAHPKALEVNGYKAEEWVGAMSQQEAAEKLAGLLKGKVIAGHNVKFDIGFVEALSASTGIQIDTRYGLDTVTLAHEHLKPIGLKSASLKNVCEFIGLAPEPDVHRALNGAKTARTVWNTLVRAGALRRLWWKIRNARKAA